MENENKTGQVKPNPSRDVSQSNTSQGYGSGQPSQFGNKDVHLDRGQSEKDRSGEKLSSDDSKLQ